MELFEEAVLAYLAGPPQRFVRPQFSLEYKGMPGGSYPDFVLSITRTGWHMWSRFQPLTISAV